MDREQVRAHWRDWASKFGTAIGATTRTGTAKILEIDALARRMSAIGLGDAPAHVLEVGCGNGLNCFGLAAQFPRMQLDGIDYTAEMIDAAREAAVANGFQDRSSFQNRQCARTFGGVGIAGAIRCRFYRSLPD